ncbi:hypothetical protein C8T65DRAFT_650039, partial [Cerioporus squamosus]
ILVQILQPAGPEDGRYPVLLWFHGGGWNNLRTVSVELGLVIILVEYRLAPEHPFRLASMTISRCSNG